MATDSTVLVASSGVGRDDVARWQHREQLRRTRQVVQLVQAGKQGNSAADGQAGYVCPRTDSMKRAALNIVQTLEVTLRSSHPYKRRILHDWSY